MLWTRSDVTMGCGNPKALARARARQQKRIGSVLSVPGIQELMTLADLLHHFEEEMARAGCAGRGRLDNNLW